MDNNARNLLYFENATMSGLYADMEAWQHQREKRLLSLSIEKDGDKFCCIALGNPTEVIICDSQGAKAQVHGYRLCVTDG
jgi:hypothetical protein